MYDYAIRFERDDTPGLAVFCRDLPQFHSYGDNEQHALSEAVDGIETTLSIYVDERRSIPAASEPEAGELVVHLPAVTVAKIALWNAMMERDMRKADLCRLLGVHQAQGDRLVDFLHTSKMEQLEAALQALRLRLFVTAKPYYPHYTIFYTLKGNTHSFPCLRNDAPSEEDAWVNVLNHMKFEIPKHLEAPSPERVCREYGVSEVAIVAA